MNVSSHFLVGMFDSVQYSLWGMRILMMIAVEYFNGNEHFQGELHESTN